MVSILAEEPEGLKVAPVGSESHQPHADFSPFLPVLDPQTSLDGLDLPCPAITW
jgi:hypothetical protein